MAFKGRGASRRGRLKSKWRPRTDGLKQRWRAPVKGEATDQLINGRRWRMQPANNPRVGSGRPAPADRQPAGWPFFLFYLFFFFTYFTGWATRVSRPEWMDQDVDWIIPRTLIECVLITNTTLAPALSCLYHPLYYLLLLLLLLLRLLRPFRPHVCVCSLWFKSIW